MRETRGSTTYDSQTWATLDALWRVGSLEHLLDPNQLGIYGMILGCEVLQFVIEAGRKVGKSWLLGVIAFEAALRHPGGRINYAAPTGKECVEITLPIMRQLAILAPPDCRPVWVPSKSHWEFPNGAFIVLFGADDEATADKGRGPESVVNIVDEGGFTPVLMYLLESVLAPQTLQALSAQGMFAKARSPWLGRTVVASSSPVSPAHEFCDIADAGQAQGAYAHRDVYTHGRMSQDEIDDYLTQRATSRNMTLEQFKQTSDFQREYMAIRVLDTTLAVLPEFPAVRARVVEAGRVAVRPPFFDLYFAGDPGMDDLFGGLWGYLDFRRSRFVIEHELLLSKANTSTFADAWKEKMIEAYPCEQTDARSMRVVTKTDAFNVIKPFSAVLDDSGKRLCADLFADHGLHFSPAHKPDREADINAVRVALSGLQLEIHPRCVHLIEQCGSAVRVKPLGDMARSKKHGHFDLISSLWYLVHTIIWSRNPYPLNYGIDPKTMVTRAVPRVRTMAEVLAGKR